MEKSGLSDIKKEYMNNTKVSQVISRNEGLIDIGNSDVIVNPQNRLTTIVNLLHEDEHVRYTGDVTLYDMAIMDAIYTLHKYGHDNFTLQMVMRVMSGNDEQGMLEEQKERLAYEIEKLRHIDILINCTDELRVRKKIGKNATVTYESYLLPLSKVDVRLGNQITVEGYKLLETPALYTYAELHEQIVDVPVQVFKTHKKLPDTNEAIVMKRYLTKRIALMKNKKNKMVSRKISYQWYDQKTQTEKGLYAVLGYKSEDYASKSSWSNKKKKIHDAVCKILDTLVEEKYIAGYHEVKENRSIVGVEIVL